MTDGTPQGNIILYQTEDGQSRIDVTLSDDTVWLTADQMAELFQRNKSTISRHIRNVFESGELKPDSVVAFFATTAADGKNYNVAYYNLDVIISVGYRVNSHRGVQFRIWATQLLREYLVKGFAMNDDLLKRADLPVPERALGIRTQDPQLRRLLLYPTELPDRTVICFARFAMGVKSGCKDRINSGKEQKILKIAAFAACMSRAAWRYGNLRQFAASVI